MVIRCPVICLQIIVSTLVGVYKVATIQTTIHCISPSCKNNSSKIKAPECKSLRGSSLPFRLRSTYYHAVIGCINFSIRFSVRTTYVGNANGSDYSCLLYTSDAADERSSVDLGGRRII